MRELTLPLGDSARSQPRFADDSEDLPDRMTLIIKFPMPMGIGRTLLYVEKGVIGSFGLGDRSMDSQR